MLNNKIVNNFLRMYAREMNLYSFERGNPGLSNESKIALIESLVAE